MFFLCQRFSTPFQVSSVLGPLNTNQSCSLSGAIYSNAFRSIANPPQIFQSTSAPNRDKSFPFLFHAEPFCSTSNRINSPSLIEAFPNHRKTIQRRVYSSRFPSVTVLIMRCFSNPIQCASLPFHIRSCPTHLIKANPPPVRVFLFTARSAEVSSYSTLFQSTSLAQHFFCVPELRLSHPRPCLSSRCSSLANLNFAIPNRIYAYPIQRTSQHFVTSLLDTNPNLCASLPLHDPSVPRPSISPQCSSFLFFSMSKLLYASPFRCHASPVSSCLFHSVSVLIRAYLFHIQSFLHNSHPTLVLLRYRCHWVMPCDKML